MRLRPCLPSHQRPALPSVEIDISDCPVFAPRPPAPARPPPPPSGVGQHKVFCPPAKGLVGVHTGWWLVREAADWHRGGGGLAQGLGIRLFAFGGACWPLATDHSDPLWVRTFFGCVNRGGGGLGVVGVLQIPPPPPAPTHTHQRGSATAVQKPALEGCRRGSVSVPVGTSGGWHWFGECAHCSSPKVGNRDL